MIKLPLTAGAAAAALLAATTAFAEEEAVVNVYNWSDYIDEEILTEFEAETGIKVVYDVFDSNNILETKLLTGSTGYDVVVPSGTFLARQIQAGIFQPLDKGQLANIGNMDETIMAVVGQWDPGNQYAINYMWGTTGFGYNIDKIAERDAEAPTGSWGMLFDPDVVSKFADCGVYMMDEPDEVVPAVLNYIGEDPNSHDTDVIAKVEPVLLAIRPHLRRFHNSAQINDLANGDICLTMGWSGDMLQARDRAWEAENNVEIAYVIPDEGALSWFDMMAIPADAPHPGNAHKFLDYIMRARGDRQGVQLRLLRQRQCRLDAAAGRGDHRGPRYLPDGGGAERALRDQPLSAKGAALHHADVDPHQGRGIGTTHPPHGRARARRS